LKKLQTDETYVKVKEDWDWDEICWWFQYVSRHRGFEMVIGMMMGF
jgi:hypothetical protein